MREFGWFQAVASWHLNIRWGSYLLFNTFFLGVTDLPEMHPRLILFHVFVLLTSITAFILLLKTIKADFGRMLPVAATLMAASLFFFTLQYAEVWLWTIGACVYILPMIGSIMLIGLLFYEGTIHLRYLWILLFSALSFGGVESWALFSYCAFMSLAIVQRARYGTWRIGAHLATVLVMGAVLGVFTIRTSPIGHRMEIDKSSVDHVQYLYEDSKYQAARIWKALDHPRYPLALLILLLIPAYLHGRPESTPLKNYLFVAIPVLVFGVVITIIPLFIVYGSVSEIRAWSPISTLLWTMLAGVSLLAHRHRGCVSAGRTRALGASLVLIGILIYGYRVIPHAQNHATAYDTRNEMFVRTCHEGNVIFVTGPLPDPGVLMSGDLARDPNNIQNEGLRKLLRIECQISQTPP